MKKILFLFISLTLTSCATYYDVSLSSVESPMNSATQYGETNVIKVNQDGLSKYQYEDDYINIFWYVSAECFNFELINKSSHTIKLNWDDMAYVDPNGVTRRIMHSGVKYIDRNSSQPASVLPKNALLSDMLLPTDNVYFVEGGYGGWFKRALFPTYSSQEDAESCAILGKTVRIVFPVVIQDVINEYIFEFKINSVTVK